MSSEEKERAPRIPRRSHNYYLYLILALVVFTAIFHRWTRSEPHQDVNIDEEYEDSTLQNELFESEVSPEGDKNIYFLENGIRADRVSVLSAQQACAIEAAATANPSWNVFLYVIDVDTYRPSPAWEVVMSLKNVHIKHVNVESYFKGTRAEAAWNELVHGEYRVSPRVGHDLLKFLLLLQHPGAFVDANMILFTPFDELAAAFVALKRKSEQMDVGNGVFRFGKSYVGRSIVSWIVENFAKSYLHAPHPQIFGPLQKGVEFICETTELEGADCNGLKVYSSRKFYPIDYDMYLHDIRDYQDVVLFVEDDRDFVMGKVKKANGAYIWHDFYNKMPYSKDAKTAFSDIAQKYCPQVFKSAETFSHAEAEEETAISLGENDSESTSGLET